MANRRLLLLCSQQLLGESLEHTFSHLEGIEMVGCWPVDEQALQRLEQGNPDLLVIGEEDPPCERVTLLTARVLESHPDLPVIRVTLARNTLRIYTSHTLPARSVDLIEVIRGLPPIEGQEAAEGSRLEQDGGSDASK